MKNCKRCGSEFEKHPKEGQKQFAARVHCSRSCAMTGIARSLEVTVERILSSSMPVPHAGCWIWMKGRTNRYGKITSGFKTIAAHRASYEVFKGAIPEGSFVCHRCDTPACVNPDHLFLGTPQENMDDMNAKGRGKPPRNFFEDDVRLIRSATSGTAALSKSFGVSRTTIKKIRSGRTYAHVS